MQMLSHKLLNNIKSFVNTLRESSALHRVVLRNAYTTAEQMIWATSRSVGVVANSAH